MEPKTILEALHRDLLGDDTVNELDLNLAGREPCKCKTIGKRLSNTMTSSEISCNLQA